MKNKLLHLFICFLLIMVVDSCNNNSVNEKSQPEEHEDKIKYPNKRDALFGDGAKEGLYGRVESYQEITLKEGKAVKTSYKKVFEPDGTMTSTAGDEKRDEKNRLTNFVLYKDKNLKQINYSYNRQGLISCLDDIAKDGSCKFKRKYYYEFDSPYPTYVDYIKGDKVISRIKYKYLEFDEHGNWTLRSSLLYNANNYAISSVADTVSRIIKYYSEDKIKAKINSRNKIRQFIEEFYDKFVFGNDDIDFEIDKWCNENMKQQLRDEYPYDCDGDSCYDLWVLRLDVQDAVSDCPDTIYGVKNIKFITDNKCFVTYNDDGFMGVTEVNVEQNSDGIKLSSFKNIYDGCFARYELEEEERQRKIKEQEAAIQHEKYRKAMEQEANKAQNQEKYQKNYDKMLSNEAQLTQLATELMNAHKTIQMGNYKGDRSLILKGGSRMQVARAQMESLFQTYYDNAYRIGQESRANKKISQYKQLINSLN